MYCVEGLLLFSVIVEENHFRGGTVTWKPINKNVTNGSQVSIIITQTYSWTLSQIPCNSSMITTQSPAVNLGSKAGSGADLMCIANCSTAGGYVGNEVPITGYCTDFTTALDLTVSQRSDTVNLTADSYFIVAFAGNGGWQTLTLGSSTDWSLSCLIDLSVRSDNGLINTAPVATCISYISVPVAISQIIQIPVLDADNDFIRCRFANGPSECVNTCPPGSLPPGTTLSSSCALTITGITAGDYYLVALQVEDFMTNSSVTPMSSVPIQFLIYVYAVPNCTLKPLLIASVNEGDCLGVQVGVTFSMTLTAINQCGSGRTMSDIATLSFPIVTKSALVQNTTNTSLWSLTVTWQPTVTEVGSQVFCAIASDSASVQSDQYCVTFYVGLNSVPLCPGATTPAVPTTVVTTIQTSEARTTSLTTQITSIVNSSVVSTTASNGSSSPSTSDFSSAPVQPRSGINWALIVGLSLLALLLVLCCSLCCCYHFLGPTVRRRRRRKIQNKEDVGELSRDSPVAFALPHFHRDRKVLKRRSREHNYDQRRNSCITTISNFPSSAQISPTPSWVNVIKGNRREKTLIDEQSMRQTPVSVHSISRVNVQRISRRNKLTQPSSASAISNENLLYSTFVSKDSSHLFPGPSSASAAVKISQVSVIKLPRLIKSSVNPHQPMSPIKAKAQLRENQQTNLNDTRKRRASSVSVTRVKRSFSAGRNQRVASAPIHQTIKQSQLSVTQPE